MKIWVLKAPYKCYLCYAPYPVYHTLKVEEEIHRGCGAGIHIFTRKEDAEKMARMWNSGRYPKIEMTKVKPVQVDITFHINKIKKEDKNDKPKN